MPPTLEYLTSATGREWKLRFDNFNVFSILIQDYLCYSLLVLQLKKEDDLVIKRTYLVGVYFTVWGEM